MQLSELYRRGAVVPLDDESQAQLQSWHVNSPIRVEYLNLSDENFYYELMLLGLFKQMSDSLGFNIDDYEEEVIHFENLAAK